MTKPAPFHLPYATALANAKKAWEEKRLGVQNGVAACKYRYGTHEPTSVGCAIGVSFPEDFARWLQDNKDGFDINYNRARVDSLINEGLLTTDNEEELAHLQLLHDCAINLSADMKATSLRHFCELIGVPYEENNA